jgi:spore germination protein KB
MEKKEIIPVKQAIALMVIFMMGSSVMMGGPREAQRDAWLAVLVSAAMALSVFFIYGRIIRLFPETDFLNILKACFGGVLGNFIYLLYILYAFYLGTLVIRNFTEFFQVSVLPETPQYVFGIAVIFVCIYMVKAGIEVLSRWSLFILPLLLAIIFLTILLALKKADFRFLQPFFQLPVPKLIESGFGQFSFPYGETVLFLMLFDSLKVGKKPFRAFYIPLAIFTALMLTVILRNLTVMGVANLKYASFPSYTAVSIIEVGTFLTRIEVIVSTVFLLCGIAKISVCLMAAAKGSARLLGIQTTRPVIAPIGVFMLFVSSVILKNTMEMFENISIYAYVAFPFQVAFPLLAWIIGEIKSKVHKGRLMPAKAESR